MAGFTGGTGVAYPTSLTEIGIALEATKGTAPSEPTYMIPAMAPKYAPDQLYIPDETLQGSMVGIYDEIRGVRYDKHGWDAPPYLDSFPLMVCMELGSSDNYTAAPSSTTLSSGATAGATTVSTAASVAANSVIAIGTGATLESHIVASVSGSGPYTLTLDYPLIWSQNSGATVAGLSKHQFSLLNNANQGQPPSCTIWDYDGEEWRTITASQMDELTVKGNATGLINYTTTFMGNPATNNVSAPSTAYTTVPTPPPFTTQCLLGGSPIQTVIDWSFGFKRGTTPIPALTGNTAYFEYLANVLQCTAKVTFVEQSGSPYLNDYENGTRQSFDITFYDQSTGSLCNIHSSNTLMTTGELDRSNPEIEVPLDLQLLPSSADALAGGRSPVIVTIANAVASQYANT